MAKLSLQESVQLLMKLFADREKTSVSFDLPGGDKDCIEAKCELKNAESIKRYIMEEDKR